MKSSSPLPILSAFVMVAIAILAGPVESQQFQTCPPGQPCPIIYSEPCPQPVYVAGPVNPVPVVAQADEVATNWYARLLGPGGRQVTGSDEATIRSWSKRAVRILNGNSCGTGNLCGRDDTSIYILTNAHVASSRIGNVVQCEALLADGSATEKFSARVVEAAYSSRTSTDWALLKADARFMRGIEPIQLSKTPPVDTALTGTWGCPRCEVPSGQLIVTRSLGSLWYWQPNSIGGQSGSAVVQGGQQKALLTWTISGDGAGQLTSTIWRQSSEQNTDGPARVDGMLVPRTFTVPDIDLVEGYHAETGLGEYPIWADSAPSNPVDPVDPDCPKVDDDTKRLLGLRDRLRERGYDWAAIISLIIQLIELFAKR